MSDNTDIPHVALYPLGPKFIEHDDDCSYAYGNKTYACYCFVYRRDALAALALEAGEDVRTRSNSERRAAENEGR